MKTNPESTLITRSAEAVECANVCRRLMAEHDETTQLMTLCTLFANAVARLPRDEREAWVDNFLSVAKLFVDAKDVIRHVESKMRGRDA